MKEPVDRRKFFKIAGTSIGVGAFFHVAPLLGQTAGGRSSPDKSRRSMSRLK